MIAGRSFRPAGAGAALDDPSADNVFVCVDRFGREAVLRGATWYDHILDAHPELTNLEAAVEAAIRLAERITIDRFDDARRCYDRRDLLRPPYRHDYLKVVVEFSPADAGSLIRGDVVTAYPIP